MNAQTDARQPEFNPTMPTNEVLTPFDVTQSSQSAGIVKLAIGFGILFALASTVYKIYNPAGTRDRNDPPLITAENTPFKVVPEDPGGFQTPDQDKEVFEVMSGNRPNTDVITLPPPEDPVARPEPVQTQPNIEAPVIQPPVQATPAPVVETPAPTPQPAPTRPAPMASDWIVQVASLRTQAEADRTYATIASQHSAIIGEYRPDIVRVDLAAKGIYYRARVAGFVSRDAASATCDRLKAAGQSCFVARR